MYNKSANEAFSIFTAEALAIVSKEIAGNSEAEAKPLLRGLVVAEKAPIKTWSDIVQWHLMKIHS